MEKEFVLLWISLLVLVGILGYLAYHQTYAKKPESPVIPMESGNFITLDKLKLSLYITRTIEAKSDTGKPIVCFIQQRFNKDFFENCIWRETMEYYMDTEDGRITTSNHYKGRVLE